MMNNKIEKIKLKNEIIRLRENGKTVREIIKMYNISTNKYYDILRNEITFNNSEEDRKRKEAIEKFKEEFKELNKNLNPETIDILEPKEFIKSEVVKITREEDLEVKLKLFYPDLKYTRDLIDKKNGEERLKVKKVDGLGTFLYYSSKGKMQFHEYMLNILIKRLKQKKIKYRKGKRKYGADLIIGKYKIELEVRSNAKAEPENRPNLIRRIEKYPENTIIIVLNKKDKEKYIHSKAKNLIHKYNRFFTMLEFVNNIDKITKIN